MNRHTQAQNNDSTRYPDKMRNLISTRQIYLILGTHLLAAAALPFYSTAALTWFLGLHILTGLFGISLGYHRLLAHRAYRAPGS